MGANDSSSRGHIRSLSSTGVFITKRLLRKGCYPIYRVVVIEDHRETGALLRTYVESELERLVTAPRMLFSIDEPPRNPKTGDRFEDAEREPGQGQLVHLRQLIDHLENIRSDPENQIDEIFPSVQLFPLEALDDLIRVADAFTPGFGHNIEEDRIECRALCEVVKSFCTPDILIVDLAMSTEEGNRMLSTGLDTVDQEKPHVLADPRTALRTLTGFKILRAYSRSVPVIVTSYWPNPLVAQHCLVNGAFAYVRKPVLSVADNGYDFRHAAEIGVTAMDRAAKLNTSPLQVVVTHYLTDATSEVLKAIHARWISTLR